MKHHAIVGTAGHIDHGKTALVKALTGIECDTHREEQRRGITINLGFAHLQLPGGDRAGIVDVPGHRDFIHTMVSGASGIDVALLVVAADGGIMPQTREHVAIMDMLGVGRGLVALTRIDLVDRDLLDMARGEVVSFVNGTFLEGCPVAAVSSKTGEGIETLRDTIAQVVGACEPRSGSGLFRMFIDRIFSVSGFGTVVTGSVLGGRAATGDRLYLLPGSGEVRIRRMERYGNEVKEVTGGDRASLNLAGLSRDEFVRGMLLADRDLKPTRMIDARVTLFPHAHDVGLWSQVQFLLGTFEAQARMHLIDGNLLRPGGEGLVQLHLPQPCTVQAGDRFVLRSSSSDRTIGGGGVIDPLPLHHRRRPAYLVEKLNAIAGGTVTDLAVAEIKKHSCGITRQELAAITNNSPADIDAIAAEFPADILSLAGEKETCYIDSAATRNIGGRITDIITAYHRRNPLDASGRTLEELQGMVGLTSAVQGKLLQLLLERLCAEGQLKKIDHTWALASHHITLSPRHKKAIDAVEGFFASAGMQVPPDTDLRRFAREQAIDDSLLKQVLNYLSGQGKIIPVEGTWLHTAVVDPIRTRLIGELERRPGGLTVAQFRDLIGGNRKICLLLYAAFDREGITERDGDVRRITENGRSLLQKKGTAA